MATSNWTVTGYRVVAEVLSKTAMIALTCQSQAGAVQQEKAVRQLWNISQVVIPACTPRSEAEKLITHWLAFYKDDELSVLGLAAFREVFASLIEQETTAPTAGQGNLN